MRFTGARVTHEQQARLFGVRKLTSVAADGEKNLSQFPIGDGVFAGQQKIFKRGVGIERR
jgi:hypothetical protein